MILSYLDTCSFHPLGHPGAFILLASHNTSEKKALLPLITNEEQAQRSAVTCLRSHSKYGSNPGFNSRHLNKMHKNRFWGVFKLLVFQTFW